MTVIAAYNDGTHVHIASDSRVEMTNNDNNSFVQAWEIGPKIFRRGDYYVGGTPSPFRLQHLEEKGSLPPTIRSIRDVRRLRDANTHPMFCLNMILVSPIGIHFVTDDGTITQCKKYIACGSGAGPALGAMKMAAVFNITGPQVVRVAVEAAILHQAGCARPIHVRSVSLRKKKKR